jgi:hypothetical protein
MGTAAGTEHRRAPNETSEKKTKVMLNVQTGRRAGSQEGNSTGSDRQIGSRKTDWRRKLAKTGTKTGSKPNWQGWHALSRNSRDQPARWNEKLRCERQNKIFGAETRQQAKKTQNASKEWDKKL